MKISDLLESFDDLPDELMDPANWKNASVREKYKALVDAGLIEKPYFSSDIRWMDNKPDSITGKMPTDDDMPYDLKNGKMDLNQIYRDALKTYKQDQHSDALSSQEREHELAIGAEGRAELKAKAEELAEIRRQQLRKEALEDAELAFQRAETVAQRQAEMEKIKLKFKHDLDMVNTEHKNNMEAIRTGNAHEIDKMNKEHQHEKTMFDKEAGEKDKDRAERERERQQNKQNSNSADVKIDIPEPEEEDEEPQDKEFQDFKADLFKLSGLPLPAPEKKDEKQPSKYNTDDAVDVDFREVPSDDEKDNQGKPSMLPAPKKEDISKFRDIVDKFEKPAEPIKANIPNLQKKFEVGQTVKFGNWFRKEDHRVGKIIKIDRDLITIDVDGKPVQVHLGNKSLSINVVDEKEQ
jgi:hypothetical protein